MTRLGLIPQLMSITLQSSADSTSTGTDGAATPTVTQYTVTAQLRPYTTAPPSTQLEAAAP
jgi:hypothetical protein